MDDFLFHKISEKERGGIQKQAKGIIDDFSRELDKVKGRVSESFAEAGDGQRDEGAVRCNEMNRETFFENAPDKSKDFIIAEMKKW